MKKYLLFIVSFALLMTVFQLLSGWLLTLLHNPDLSVLDSNASQEVMFGEYSPVPFLGALVTATLAYFISHKFSSSK